LGFNRLALMTIVGLAMLLWAVMPASGQQTLVRMPVVVVFQVENDAGQAAAEKCHDIWLNQGPSLTAQILPPEPAKTVPDTVTCLILNTASFQRHFAGRLPDWGVGVAVPSGKVIALDYSRVTKVGRGLREVFLHEMVHALLFQGTAGAWLPAWFHEGAAMLHSGEWKFADTVSLVLDGNVPDLSRLQGRFPVPHDRADRAYRTSLLAVSRLQENFGDAVIADLVRETKSTQDFPTAFAGVTGQDLGAFQSDFASAMRLKYGWVLFMTRWPGLFVLAALILAAGAIRKILINRRRMAAMEDEEPFAQEWPPGPGTAN
jgi:hypothetical protein